LAIYSGIYIFDSIHSYDTGLYHLQNIKWIEESNLPFGLANLHSRFGFNVLWFLDAAVISPFYIGIFGRRFFINSIVYFLWFITVYKSIKNILVSRKWSLIDIYWSLSIFPLINSSDSLSSPEPDYPILAIGLLAFALFLRSLYETNNRKESTISLLLTSSFLFMIKLSFAIGMLFTGLLFLVNIIKKEIRIKDILKPAFFVFLFLSIWISRGIITSGAPFYPSSFFYFEKLPWSVTPSTIKGDSVAVIGWARMPGPHYRDAVNNWNWIIPWINRNKKNISFWAILFIIGTLSIVFANKKNFREIFYRHIFSFAFPIAGIIFWFFTAPDFRFGRVYFTLLVLLLFSISLNSISPLIFKNKSIQELTENKKLPLLIKITLSIILITFLLLHNSISIKNFVENKSGIPEVSGVKRILDNGTVIYMPNQGSDQAWDLPLPSSPYMVEVEIEKDNKGKIRKIYDKNKAQ